MNNNARLFAHGFPSCHVVPRWSAASACSAQRVASELNRPVFYKDYRGYECEIIGGACKNSSQLAYVETRAREDATGCMDISIKMHLIEDRCVAYPDRTIHVPNLPYEYDTTKLFLSEIFQPFGRIAHRTVTWICLCYVRLSERCVSGYGASYK